jgi:hypothetical protein
MPAEEPLDPRDGESIRELIVDMSSLVVEVDRHLLVREDEKIAQASKEVVERIRGLTSRFIPRAGSTDFRELAVSAARELSECAPELLLAIEISHGADPLPAAELHQVLRNAIDLNAGRLPLMGALGPLVRSNTDAEYRIEAAARDLRIGLSSQGQHFNEIMKKLPNVAMPAEAVEKLGLSYLGRMQLAHRLLGVRPQMLHIELDRSGRLQEGRCQAQREGLMDHYGLKRETALDDYGLAQDEADQIDAWHRAAAEVSRAVIEAELTGERPGLEVHPYALADVAAARNFAGLPALDVPADALSLEKRILEASSAVRFYRDATGELAAEMVPLAARAALPAVDGSSASAGRRRRFRVRRVGATRPDVDAASHATDQPVPKTSDVTRGKPGIGDKGLPPIM